MDQQKVDLFIMTNKDYLPEEKILYVKEKLQSLPEEKLSLISTICFCVSPFIPLQFFTNNFEINCRYAK